MNRDGTLFLPGVDASHVYVRTLALGCFYSHISTQTHTHTHTHTRARARARANDINRDGSKVFDTQKQGLTEKGESETDNLRDKGTQRDRETGAATERHRQREGERETKAETERHRHRE